MLSSIKSIAKNPLASKSAEPALNPSALDRDEEMKEPPLERSLAFIVGISALVATSQAKKTLGISTIDAEEAEAWLKAVCENLQLDPSVLPPAPTEADLLPMLPTISRADFPLIAHTLLVSSIFPPKQEATRTSDCSLKATAYTSSSRATVFRTLSLLGIDPRALVVREESAVAAELFQLLKTSTEGDSAKEKDKEDIEKVRKEKEDGWGGKWGRWAATGAGVVIGGVAIGLTGGLAAPAILALLPASLGILSASTAPVVLGTLFGLTGGGLAGKRVSRRWAGVGEFEFVEVGREAEKKEVVVPVAYEARKKKGAASPPPADEETLMSIPPRPPSLTVIIALPGLLLDDADEGVRAWSKVASSLRAGPAGSVPTEAADEKLEQEEFDLVEPEENQVEELDGDEGALLLRGRDLFVGKVDTLMMLSSGKNINDWFTNKLIAKAGREVIKRTVVNAYFAAVALPLTVYGWAGTLVDNTWIQSADKSRKAGSLLASILLSRTQGARPVVLVGHSLGALTVFHALLELSSSTAPHAKELVDSAILISLPSAPSTEQWKAARTVSGRRLVNAHSRKDFVLASVVRLHEVVGGVTEGRVGLKVAGLGEVGLEGVVEDVDLSGVVKGHFDINKKLPEILRIVDMDA